MALAVVFPGQGSQAVGMLQTIANEPIVQNTLAEANEALQFDIATLIASGPAEQLNQTQYTQAALLAASVAVWRHWQQQGGHEITINYLAGHSLGEYSALVCADAMAFADAVRLVYQRGLLMQRAVPVGSGAMAAVIGLPIDIIKNLCATQTIGIVEPANINSHEQIVISGETAAVQAVCDLAKPAGAKLVKMLAVSVPSHSSLMKNIVVDFQQTLTNVAITTPKYPVINNVDVFIEHNPEAIRSALLRQLYSPVRWCEIIEMMVSQGVDRFFECGPGKVLTGLTKRIAKDSVLYDMEKLPNELTF